MRVVQTTLMVSFMIDPTSVLVSRIMVDLILDESTHHDACSPKSRTHESDIHQYNEQCESVPG